MRWCRDLKARHGTVSGDGLELSYTEWTGSGNGSPLLLLHGITGNRADWDAVVDAALGRSPSSFSRVIALDARGHGESDWDRDGAYSGDSHFADVVTAMDGLELTDCIVAGYSMGGGVAIMAAAAVPSRCRGLIVVDTYPDPEMTPGSLSIARAIAGWWEAGQGTPATEPREGLWGGAAFDPEIARSFARELEAGSARRLDLWPFWTSLTCPTLLIRGGLSSVMPAVVAHRMTESHSLAELVEVPGTGHNLLFGASPAVAEQIVRFIERVAED